MTAPIPDPGAVPDEPGFTDLPRDPDPLGDATTRPEETPDGDGRDTPDDAARGAEGSIEPL